MVRETEFDPRKFSDLSEATIVVVDDLAFGRTLARSLLMAAGAKRVEVAANVSEGAQVIFAIKPDLLVLDWQLDGAPGLELVDWVRNSADSPNPYLAILMLTAFREEHRVRQAVSAGVNNYLAKPFSPLQFLEKVEACMNDRRPFTRTPDYFGPSLRGMPQDTVELD